MIAPQLQDIIPAPEAHWFPLAPGWYFIAFLITTVIIFTVLYAYRAWQRRSARRIAMRTLRQQEFDSIVDINLILKQAALVYLPAPQVSQLSGAAWTNFLLAQLSKRQAHKYQSLLAQVAQASYMPPSAAQPAVADYQAFALDWLRRALPPTKNARQEAHHD